MAPTGSQWNTRYIWNGRAATLADAGLGFSALREDAEGAWRFFSAVQSSPVGTATSWPINVSGKLTMIERCGGQTRSDEGSDGEPG